MTERFSYGASTLRDGGSVTARRALLRALALASEIMRLERLTGHLRFPGPRPVAKLRLAWTDRPETARWFVPRTAADAPGPGPGARRAAKPEAETGGAQGAPTPESTPNRASSVATRGPGGDGTAGRSDVDGGDDEETTAGPRANAPRRGLPRP